MDSLRSFAKSSADRLRAKREAGSSSSERPEDAEVVAADGAADKDGAEEAKKVRGRTGPAWSFNKYVALAGGYPGFDYSQQWMFRNIGRMHPISAWGVDVQHDLDSAFAQRMLERYQEYVQAQKEHNSAFAPMDMETWQAQVDYGANRDHYIHKTSLDKKHAEEWRKRMAGDGFRKIGGRTG